MRLLRHRAASPPSPDPPAATAVPPGPATLGDDPIVGPWDDRLGRVAFAARMAQLIKLTASQTPSAVVGLIGPWGSGKSSVLQLLRQEIAKDEHWSVVDFNPWVMSDVSSLTTEFMATIQAALPAKSPVRKKLAAYARRIAPFTTLAAVTGVDPSAALDAAASRLEGDTSLEGVRQDLEQALREHGRPILVLIDDVDRLQGDELAALLKLVRLAGRLPHVFYVLAYDETTLLDVLGTTDVARADPGRALAYLDKIVQLRLDLPPVPQVLLDRMVDTCLEHVTSSNDVALDSGDEERIALAYDKHLRHVLVEPRHVKRFFAQMEAVYPLVGQEVDFVDFLLITFLRTFYPEVHRLLRASEPELTGTSIAEAFNRPTVEQRIATWRTRLLSDEVGLSERDADRVLALLGDLFPPLSQYGHGRVTSRAVGSSEYFARYLYLAVPPDDVTDSEVRATLAEVSAGPAGPLATTLLEKLAAASEAIVDKLRRYSPTDPTQARSTLPFAAHVLRVVPEAGLLGRTRAVPAGWIGELLGVADLTDPTALLDDLLGEVDLREVNRCFRYMRKDRADRGEGLTAAQQAFEQLLIERTKGLVAQQVTQTPEQADRPLRLLIDWAYFESDDVVRTFVQEQVSADSPWTIEEVVVLFASVNISGAARWAGEVDLQLLNQFVGIDFTLARYEFHQDPTIRWHDHVEPTWDERRRRAHHVLATEAERRRTTQPEAG